MSEIKQLYQQLLPTGGFLLDNGNSKTEENQFCYALSPDKGKGVFWQYFFENMFEVTKQDFTFLRISFWNRPNRNFCLLLITLPCQVKNFILTISYLQTVYERI